MPFQPKNTILLFACLLMALVGCARDRHSKELGSIYNALAQAPDFERNPIIVIPGILGSRLVETDSGKVVWGTIDSRHANPNDPEIAKMLAMPMVEGARLADLKDNVKSTGPLDRLKIRFWGIPINVSAYDEILNTLGVGGYRDPSSADVQYDDDHFTCFQFHFDWRRDIAESVQELHRYIVDREAFSREEYRRRYGIESPRIKFDVVAHSMGSLILRYYLRYGNQPLPEDGSLPQLTWEGAKYVDRAIMIAPPNQGSALTVKELIAGSKFSSFLPVYPPSVLGTMPSVYQLIPRTRTGFLTDKDNPSKTLDVFDPKLWEDLEWGLTAPDQDYLLEAMLPEAKDRKDRLRIANEHRRKCLARAKQLHAAIDFPATPPPGVQLHLFAGSSEPTADGISVDMKTGEFEISHKGPGDGTVARASAIMIEEVPDQKPVPRIYPIAWSSKTFIPSNHLGLTKHPIFVDNVLSLLLESRDAADISAIRSAQAKQGIRRAWGPEAQLKRASNPDSLPLKQATQPAPISLPVR